jgi:hypothetical protein
MGKVCTIRRRRLIIHGGSYVYNVIASVCMLFAIGSAFGFAYGALQFSVLDAYTIARVSVK